MVLIASVSLSPIMKVRRIVAALSGRGQEGEWCGSRCPAPGQGWRPSPLFLEWTPPLLSSGLWSCQCLVQRSQDSGSTDVPSDSSSCYSTCSRSPTPPLLQSTSCRLVSFSVLSPSLCHRQETGGAWVTLCCHQLFPAVFSRLNWLCTLL